MNRIVVNNYPYDPCSGGIKVLQYLTFLLDMVGVPTAGTSPCFFNPLIPVVDKCGPDDICVYPDVVEGNPLGAQRIVRYLLFFPRHRVAANECPIVYMPEYLESCRQRSDAPIGNDDVVELPNIEAAPWCFPEGKTVENVLYTGKEICKELPDISYVNMPNLGDQDRFRLRYSCLALLRRARNFYTTDHFTVMEHEAFLCGCKVFKVHGKSDFREQHPNANSRIMRPMSDQFLAEKFSSIVNKFFHL